MITTIEIAKILLREKQKAKKNKSGFDAGLLSLGTTTFVTKKRRKK